MVPRGILTVGVVLLMAAVASGCATIFTGTTNQVSINSDPPGAEVIVNGRMGVTPLTLDLPKGKTYTVTFSKPGYYQRTAVIGTKFQALFLGNLICTGLIGMIIDIATGAWMDLDPRTINVKLEPKGASKHSEAPEPQIYKEKIPWSDLPVISNLP